MACLTTSDSVVVSFISATRIASISKENIDEVENALKNAFKRHFERAVKYDEVADELIQTVNEHFGKYFPANRTVSERFSHYLYIERDSAMTLKF